jgi:hypothetical protein
MTVTESFARRGRDLTPIFGVFSTIKGRGKFPAKTERLGFILSCAGLGCASARHLPALQQRQPAGNECQRDPACMMIPLAPGTIVFGAQARVRQIFAISGVAWCVTRRSQPFQD